MKLDCYPHVLPQPVSDALTTIPLPTLVNPALTDLDERFRVMDRFDDYAQVLVPFPLQPLVPALRGAAIAHDVIRSANDWLAATTQDHPERFVAFAAAVPLGDPEQAAAEVVRCIDELGAVGVQLETNVGGIPIDDPRYEQVFAEVAARGRAIWLHPVRGKAIGEFASEDTGRFALWQALGWPYETSLILARLVLQGYLDRYPDLPIIVHHGGGMVPHYSGRLGAVLEELGRIGLDAELQQSLEERTKPLDDYFRMFYADTVLFGAGHAVDCVLDYFGVDHVLFGTDMPFDPEQGPGFIRDTIANVEALGLDDNGLTAVYEGNLRRLLRL